MSDTVNTVGFQGEMGAYSEGAAHRAYPQVKATGYRTFAEVFTALAEEKIDSAVLPVENSLAGVVQEVSDLLWHSRGVTVTGGLIQPIKHCLLGKQDKPLRAISHPQALAQCSIWLAKHEITPVPFYDTAGAAAEVAFKGQPGDTAIASAEAAEHYGLPILAENIANHDNNFTRFVILKRGPSQLPARVDSAHKVLLGFTLAHQPGSLVSVLQSFSRHGANMSRLDSRPILEKPFEYRFYIDCEVPAGESPQALIQELEANTVTVHIFGIYPI